MFRRLLLLAPVGILAGHLTGYAAVGHAHADGVPHSHLPVVAALALPVGLWALVACVRERRDSLDRPARLVLVAVQVLGFLAMEVAERAVLAGGVLAVATEPAVLAGLVAQILVAWVLMTTVRTGQIAVDAISRSSTLVGPVASVGGGSAGWILPPGSSHVPTNLGRAPPVLLAD